MGSRLVLSVAVLGALGFWLYQLTAPGRAVDVPEAVARAEGRAVESDPPRTVELQPGAPLASPGRTPKDPSGAAAHDPRVTVLQEGAPCTLRCVLHPVEGDRATGASAIIVLSGYSGIQSVKHHVVIPAPATGVFTIQGLAAHDWTVVAAIRTEHGAACSKATEAYFSEFPGDQQYEVHLTPRHFRLQGSLGGLSLEDLAAVEATYLIQEEKNIQYAAQSIGVQTRQTRTPQSSSFIPLGSTPRALGVEAGTAFPQPVLAPSFTGRSTGEALPLELDRLGAFEVPVVGPCEVVLEIKGKPGRWLPGSLKVRLDHDAPVQTVTLDVAAPSSLTLDPTTEADNATGRSARLQIRRSGADATHYFPHAGPYRVPDLEPGPLEYWLEVEGDAPSIAWGEVTILAQQESRPVVDLAPLAPRAVHGRLVDAEDKPLMFRTVNLHLGALKSAYATARTGRRGEFTLDAPSVGTFGLTVEGVPLMKERVHFTVKGPVGDGETVRPKLDLGELVARRRH